MEYFIELFLGGLTRGSIYALIALGYTMVYGIIQLINFAHGEMMTLGMYIAILLFAALGMVFSLQILRIDLFSFYFTLFVTVLWTAVNVALHAGIGLALALAIGLSLGFFGGGGSILTVPVLVYLRGQPEKLAIAGSLAIVGAIAAATTGAPTVANILGALAIVTATINVVGGFLVTDRMLRMFGKKKK